MRKTRVQRLKKGMHLDEVKEIFGNDMWRYPGSETAWLVNDEGDKDPNHGCILTFDDQMKFVEAGHFSIA